jgi:hypothetical protein
MMNRFLAPSLALLLLSSPAQAYIGPGVGLGAIGLTLALIVGALLLVVGFLWYPLKRLLRGRKATRDAVIPDKDK